MPRLKDFDCVRKSGERRDGVQEKPSITPVMIGATAIYGGPRGWQGEVARLPGCGQGSQFADPMQTA